MVRVSILALLIASTAIADEDTLRLHPGMMGVADIGIQPCSVFSEMHYNGPTGMEHHVLTWVQGYVHAQTGANIDTLLRELPDGHGWSFSTLSGRIVSYCKANPDAPVHEAAISLAAALQSGETAN